MPAVSKILKAAAIAGVVGIAVGVATTYLLPSVALWSAQALGATGLFGTTQHLLAIAFGNASFHAGTIGLFFGISGALGVVANGLLSPAESPALLDSARAAPTQDAGLGHAPTIGTAPAIVHAHAPQTERFAAADKPAIPTEIPTEIPGATIRLPALAARVAEAPSLAHGVH